jgi:predicted permease
MFSFWTILSTALPIFLIIGLGAFLRRNNWLTEEADQSLLRLTVHVLYPCLIFESIVGNAALKQAGTVFIAPLLGFATVLGGCAIAFAAGRWLGFSNPMSRKSFAFTTALYNYGYIPVPLAAALFDKQTLGVLFVFNLGVEISMWLLAAWLSASHRFEWRRLINGPILAIIVALLFNAAGDPSWIPGFLHNGMKMLGSCAIPLSLLLVGAITADLLFREKIGFAPRVIFTACLLRNGLLPLAFVALAVFLPLSAELKVVLAIQAAMPAAVFPIVLVRHYRGDTRTALAVVLSTSLLALATLPLWLKWGLSVQRP